MVGEGFEPSKALSRQIYSLLPLAAWVPHRARPHRAQVRSRQSRRRDLNSQPADYKSAALPLSYVGARRICARRVE
jgi:hypothetical protein